MQSFLRGHDQYAGQVSEVALICMFLILLDSVVSNLCAIAPSRLCVPLI